MYSTKSVSTKGDAGLEPGPRFVAVFGQDSYLDADAHLEPLLQALAADWQLGGQDVVVWDGDRVAALLRGAPDDRGPPEVVRFPPAAPAGIGRACRKGKR
jgi:hypothetical protein